MSVERCNNIADLRRRAKQAAGADVSLCRRWRRRRMVARANNSSAFDAYEFMPRYPRNIADIDLSTRVLGCELGMPLILAPTGMSRLFHHEKELGVAKAAASSMRCSC